MHVQKGRWLALAGAALLLTANVLPWACCAARSLGGEAAVTAGGEAAMGEPSGGPPLVALTFDDGPSSVTTPVLLDGLAKRGVHATFFLVGSMAADNHSLVRRMADEGHQIGVHTYDHSVERGLTGLSEAQFRAQVDTTRDLLTALTGQTEFMLRPPYGFVDDSVRLWADAPIILWSIDPEDWDDQNAGRVAEHIIARAEDGAIILLHDIFSTSVEGALAVVDALLEEGYLFVTVEELFQARGAEAKAGEVYNCVP